MGWDVMYHPVGGDEIDSIYFATLADAGRETEVAKRFGLDPFYAILPTAKAPV